jgi:glycosyltransferase involved in cell wall biosynthesis
MYCGKFIAKKRPLDLVAAARRAPLLAGRPVHLLFVGDGELGPELRRALDEPGAPAATITGFLNQNEIAAAFAAADCLVLASDYGETWGLVVNEALASGLPVVVSDHCGCAEDLARPLGARHVYPCGDHAALAESLRQVASSPPAKPVIASLIESHSPRRTAETVAAVLRSAGRGQPDPR